MQLFKAVRCFGFCLVLVLISCAHMTKKDPRTDDEIQAVFDQNKSQLYSAYQKALRGRPDLTGRTLFRIVIEPSGRVSACSVEKTTVDEPDLNEALCLTIRNFDFGEKNTGRLSITYPIEFLAR